MIRVPDGEFFDEFYESDEFEAGKKMKSCRGGAMPVQGAAASIRGRHRDKSGQRPRRKPRRPDGMHRRRVRKME